MDYDAVRMILDEDRRGDTFVTEGEITILLRAAIDEEREACAQIVEEWDPTGRSTPQLAALIRARAT